MKRLIILLYLCVFSLTFMAQSGWLWQNPLPQGNRLNAVSMYGSHWAVGDMGTVIHHIMPGDYWEIVDIGTNEDLNGVYVNSISAQGWIVGDNGTIYYTGDKGETWLKQYSGTSENLNSVSSVDMACTWVCGDKGTVLKSLHNSGGVWENVSPPHRVNFNDIDSYHCNEAWVVGEQGVLIYTSDGGRVWQNGFAGTSWDLTGIDMSESSASYLCGYSGIVLKKDWDATEWVKENENLAYRLNDMTKALGSPGYAVGTYGTILKGSNDIWEQLDSEVPWTLWDVDDIALQDYSFQIVGDCGIMLRNDGWDSEFNIVNDICWNFVLGIHFVNANVGWAVTSDNDWDTRKDGVILHTTDGGTSWIKQREVESSLQDVFFISENEGWAVGRDGTILHTTSAGAGWNTQSSPINGIITSVHFVDEENGWIVSSSNWGEVAHTTNGGANWTKQTNPSNNPLHDVFFIDAQNGWAVGLDSSVIRTQNGGETWQWYDVNASRGYRFASVFFVDDLHGWMAGIYGSIMRTTDGGDTWQEIESGVSESFNDIIFTDKHSGWAVGDRGLILRSLDGGQTWFKQYSPVATNYLSTVHFIDSVNGWIGGQAGTIIKTNNGGFRHSPGSFWLDGLDILIEDNQMAHGSIFVDVDGTIIKNTNLSERDIRESDYIITGLEVMLDSIMHKRLNDLSISLSHKGVSVNLIEDNTIEGANFLWTTLSDAETKLISEGEAPFYGDFKPENPLSAFNGLDPNGEWTLNISDGVVGEEGMLKAWGIKPVFEKSVSNNIGISLIAGQKIQLYQNIPNPFNNNTQIAWSSKISGQTILKLYDISGQLINILQDEYLKPGNFTLNLDGSTLSPGIYFYQLKIDQYSLTKKLVMQ